VVEITFTFSAMLFAWACARRACGGDRGDMRGMGPVHVEGRCACIADAIVFYDSSIKRVNAYEGKESEITRSM